MRIEQLLELVTPTRTQRNTNLNLRRGDDNARDVLGQGLYSTVKNDRTDPHMVRKHHHAPLDDHWNDGFIDFINYLIDNNLSSVNLPRIYDVTEIKDRDGKKIYKYKVEKLIPSDDISLDELLALVNRTVKGELNYDKHTSKEFLKSEILYQLGSLFEKAVESGDYSRIADEEMVNTLQIIANFKKNSATPPDIDIANPSNIMFRRGRYGLQLVISDPIG